MEDVLFAHNLLDDRQLVVLCKKREQAEGAVCSVAFFILLIVKRKRCRVLDGNMETYVIVRYSRMLGPKSCQSTHVNKYLWIVICGMSTCLYASCCTKHLLSRGGRRVDTVMPRSSWTLSDDLRSFETVQNRT